MSTAATPGRPRLRRRARARALLDRWVPQLDDGPGLPLAEDRRRRREAAGFGGQRHHAGHRRQARPLLQGGRRLGGGQAQDDDPAHRPGHRRLGGPARQARGRQRHAVGPPLRQAVRQRLGVHHPLPVGGADVLPRELVGVRSLEQAQPALHARGHRPALGLGQPGLGGGDEHPHHPGPEELLLAHLGAPGRHDRDLQAPHGRPPQPHLAPGLRHRARDGRRRLRLPDDVLRRAPARHRLRGVQEPAPSRRGRDPEPRRGTASPHVGADARGHPHARRGPAHHQAPPRALGRPGLPRQAQGRGYPGRRAHPGAGRGLGGPAHERRRASAELRAKAVAEIKGGKGALLAGRRRRGRRSF